MNFTNYFEFVKFIIALATGNTLLFLVIALVTHEHIAKYEYLTFNPFMKIIIMA